MQYRRCVGGGPCGKTWPRWASQRAQDTSSRCMPRLLSIPTDTFSFAMGAQKLGQPVPDSNFVLESNSAVPQQIHRYNPSAWLLAYLPVNARSVPFRRVTSNCSGVSCAFHSASGFRILSTSITPFRWLEGLNWAILTVLLP